MSTQTQKPDAPMRFEFVVAGAEHAGPRGELCHLDLLDPGAVPRYRKVSLASQFLRQHVQGGDCWATLQYVSGALPAVGSRVVVEITPPEAPEESQT